MSALPERAEARVTTRSAQATFDLGARLGRALAPGDVVALVGELGAGKTQLARGVCRGAGVKEGEVSSPTFAIVATYRGRIAIHHADLFRVGSEDELHATGFHDLLGGEGAVLVEWADRFPGALPRERLEIALGHDPSRPSVRRLAITGTGTRHAGLVRGLARRIRLPRRGAAPRARAARRRSR